MYDNKNGVKFRLNITKKNINLAIKKYEKINPIISCYFSSQLRL